MSDSLLPLNSLRLLKDLSFQFFFPNSDSDVEAGWSDLFEVGQSSGVYVGQKLAIKTPFTKVGDHIVRFYFQFPCSENIRGRHKVSDQSRGLSDSREGLENRRNKRSEGEAGGQ